VARPGGRGLERYLLDGERIVVAMHQHWAKVAEPVASVLAALVVVTWLDTELPRGAGLFADLIWWAWFAVLGRTLWRLANWRHDWFIATDKRLLLTYGLFTNKVAMMPLAKVTDMSYNRSIPGRVLGYGRFVMATAGQDQALREVNWVPDPDHHYRAICAEIFRVADRIRLSEPLGGEGAGVPEPYAGWDDPRYGADRSTAIPIRPVPDGDVRDGSLYRSPDLQARDRSADTGPIPLRPRRDWPDD